MQVIISKLAKAEIKNLAKKYKNILSDLDEFIKEIKNNNLGDRLQGLPIPIYKSRIKNSSNNKGKSSGFRIIYHLKINNIIYILSIYSKNEKGNINQKDIIEAIKQLPILKT